MLKIFFENVIELECVFNIRIYESILLHEFKEKLSIIGVYAVNYFWTFSAKFFQVKLALRTLF